MPPIRDVVGYCPMGCGQHLHLMPGGMVKCLAPECPDPGSVTKLLSDPETEHVADFTDDGWTLKHPLHERLDDGLFACGAGSALACFAEAGTLPPPGRWRFRLDADGTLPPFEQVAPDAAGH
jgi:hypothetical protein